MAPDNETMSMDEAKTANPALEEKDLDSSSGVRRWLREPMLHFVLLGASLFALYSFTGDNEDGMENSQIVVSQGKIEHLATLFGRTWQRPPTRAELEGLVNDYVREEVAYREGIAIGLDRNDTIIRRRIRQKLDFVADDFASQLQATDEELQKYLEQHADDFRVAARLTFQQVFFDPSKHSDDLNEEVGDLVSTLRDDASIDAREQGDRTLLEFRYEDVSEQEIANMFGVQFAEAVAKLDEGRWEGPVESAFGVHAVLVESSRPGKVPDLDSAREEVRREWEHVRRQELTEEFYRGLLEKYEVSVEWPEVEAAE